jgi:hypothetical protein
MPEDDADATLVLDEVDNGIGHGPEKRDHSTTVNFWLPA